VAKHAHKPAIAGRARNISTETPLSALAMTRAVLAACGREDLEPEILGEARFEIVHQYLSAVRIREELGWHPRFDVQAGLARTVDWYRNHLGAVAAVHQVAA